MSKKRAPHTELELRAMQGGSRNPQRPGLRTAANYLKNLFAIIPGEGEAFITETGKTGRIGRSQMCGSCPEGMVRCYRIYWSEEYKD